MEDLEKFKFRGKRIDNSDFVEGYYVAWRVTGGGKLYHHIKNAIDTYEVHPESITFLGYKAKNEKIKELIEKSERKIESLKITLKEHPGVFRHKRNIKLIEGFIFDLKTLQNE